MITHYLRVTFEIDTIIMYHHPRVTTMIATIMTTGTGVDLADPDPTPTTTDIGMTVTMTQGEVILGPITNLYTTAHLIT